MRKRPRPAGLMAGPFLWARGTGMARIHHRAAMAGRGRIPLPLWWVYQLYLYFVWQRRTLPTIPAEAWPDEAAARAYGRGWCLTPADLRFAASCGADDPLTCVYPVETKGIHALLNRGQTGAPQTLTLLHDKTRATAHFAEQGLPTLPSLCVARSPDDFDLNALLADHDALFLKGQVSARGRGALKIWRDPDGSFKGLTFGGGSLCGENEVMAAMAALARLGAFIVQPYAVPHPDLAPLCAPDEVPTVRVITIDRDRSGIDLLLATLEVPRRGEGDEARTHYRFLNIDLETGGFSYRWKEDETVTANIPFWQQIAAGALTAHRSAQGPWAIAWDWVVTPEGAFLLEGNGGFALGELQRRYGPLLLQDDVRPYLPSH